MLLNSMEKKQNILVVGLPEAGKSSFIHALDDILQNPPSGAALRAFGLAADRSYLERDKAKFRNGQTLEHTERNLQGAIPELLFEDPISHERGRLLIPDLSGEIFQDQWVHRLWAKTYREQIQNVSGALVFVRADVESSNQELLGKMIGKGNPDKSEIPWDPKKASQQVQLVDVLQFIPCHASVNRPLRVAILISAWDTVLKPNNHQPKNPTNFLRREWAFLYQYLASNPEMFTTKIYGVSALGGDEKERKGKLSKIPPEERVKLVDDDDESKDLTRPLRWLLNSA